MNKISYLKRYNNKLPERLIFQTKRKLNSSREYTISRILEPRTGRWLGEMTTESRASTCFGYFPNEKRLCIVYLRAYVRNKGVGSDLLNFSKFLSKQEKCDGKIYLLSSDCFDKSCPPHVFYRKFGFTSFEKDKIKNIDRQILTGKPECFNFNDITMFYAPQRVIGEFQENTQKETNKAVKNKFSNFIKKIFKR